uniref:Uncharacterized protein n=1 Tax=Romanomermis culicivorax TaxID=13658 RepID=A0A915IV22_ROMCU
MSRNSCPMFVIVALLTSWPLVFSTIDPSLENDRHICDRSTGLCYKATPVGTGPFAYCSTKGSCVQGRCMGGGRCFSIACDENDQNSCPNDQICDNKACRPSIRDDSVCRWHFDCPKPGKCIAGFCYSLKYPREFSCVGDFPPDVNRTGFIIQCKIGSLSSECPKNSYCVGYQGSNVGQNGYCCPRTDLPNSAHWRGSPYDNPKCPNGDALFYDDHGWECGQQPNSRSFAHYDGTVKRKYACCTRFCDKLDEFFDGKLCRKLGSNMKCFADNECPRQHLHCINSKANIYVDKRL